MVNRTTTEGFRIPLPSGGIAALQVPFPMSDEDFRQLTSTLQIWKEALVNTGDPEPMDKNDQPNGGP